jgi:hypothetical protein
MAMSIIPRRGNARRGIAFDVGKYGCGFHLKEFVMFGEKV